MVGDDELAADLAQETFVKAYRAFDTLQDLALARAWLYRISGRTALDELRGRKLGGVPWAGETRSTVASTEEAALRGRLTGELERALAAIPERQRMRCCCGTPGAQRRGARGRAGHLARCGSRAARPCPGVAAQALAVERARTATADARPRATAGRLHLPGAALARPVGTARQTLPPPPPLRPADHAGPAPAWSSTAAVATHRPVG